MLPPNVTITKPPHPPPKPRLHADVASLKIMSLPYPIKPNFSICFKGFSQIAKTVSHVKNQICIILAENESKYTEKASIFYHLFLLCLIFSYIIGAKSFSHFLPPMTRPILIPIRAHFPSRPSLLSPAIFPTVAAVRAFTAVSALKMPQIRPVFGLFVALFWGQFALLYRPPLGRR